MNRILTFGVSLLCAMALGCDVQPAEENKDITPGKTENSDMIATWTSLNPTNDFDDVSVYTRVKIMDGIADVSSVCRFDNGDEAIATVTVGVNVDDEIVQILDTRAESVNKNGFNCSVEMVRENWPYRLSSNNTRLTLEIDNRNYIFKKD